MPRHDLSSGSPLDTAVVSVENIQHSLRFYAQALGLTASDVRQQQDATFLRHWHLPDDTPVKSAFLHAGADPVGRVALLEFGTEARRQIRPAACRRATGLFNLNFYTRDIGRDYDHFSAMGYEFWSRPVQHDFGADVGTPIEVVFDGPDGIAVNLVQLETPDPDTLIGEMRRFVKAYGRTSTGYTPVVTSAHTVTSMEKAVAFYEQVLGMHVAIDNVLEAPESNRFLGLTEDARTHVVFVQGAHMFGKVALSQPLNYVCEDLTEHARAPNIGYLAQSFRVDNLLSAAQSCEQLGVVTYSPPVELNWPGRGVCRSMIVENPGSGALQELYEALDPGPV